MISDRPWDIQLWNADRADLGIRVCDIGGVFEIESYLRARVIKTTSRRDERFHSERCNSRGTISECNMCVGEYPL